MFSHSRYRYILTSFHYFPNLKALCAKNTNNTLANEGSFREKQLACIRVDKLKEVEFGVGIMVTCSNEHFFCCGRLCIVASRIIGVLVCGKCAAVNSEGGLGSC